jgi:hypothetical protein
MHFVRDDQPIQIKSHSHFHFNFWSSYVEYLIHFESEDFRAR